MKITYKKRRTFAVVSMCLSTFAFYLVSKQRGDDSDLTEKVIYGPRLNPKRCPNLKKPVWVPDRQVWSNVSINSSNVNHRESMYVFSAYYDTSLHSLGSRYSKLIRIIGIVRQRHKIDDPFCQVWYYGAKELVTVRALVELIPEGHQTLYQACYFVCPLRNGELPYAVSLVTEPCLEPFNIIPVKYPSKVTHRYTVCVNPIHYHYNNINQLVEMLELNGMFGANYFVMYNISMGRDVNRVLSQYKTESTLEIIQWQIPVKMDTFPSTPGVEIHYFGQLAAINDCLYRHRSSTFITFLDLDEIIVPRKDKNWDEMVQRIETIGKVPDYMTFRCAMFRTEWPDLAEEFPVRKTATKYQIQTLLKVNREKRILPSGSRSKLMLKPDKIITVGIHNVWSRQRDAVGMSVDPSIGLLHHYRNWSQSTVKENEIDTNLHRFASDIGPRILQRFMKLGK